MKDITKRVKGLSSLIGNTPLLAINFTYKGEKRTIYAKAENLNMTGSIKDRMALHTLYNAYKSGDLKPGDMIIEATSGNTGISMAAIGKALGHPVTIFMPDWMSIERINLIKSLGAEIILVSKEEGGFKGSIQMSEEMAKGNEHSFLPCQFSNEFNVDAHYQSTAPELWWQLKYRSLEPDAFVAGVGTGGTVMGVAKFLKEKNPNINVHPLEPSNSPTMSTGCKVGKHRIQGISDEFIPAIVEFDKLDRIVAIDDGDAIIMSQMLSQQLGLAVGISSGGNFIGALQLQNEMGSNAVVVTVFADSNKKYLSTDLMRKEPLKDDFLSPDVKLENFIAFKRVCHTCCDPIDCVEGHYKDSDALTLPHCARRSNH